MHEAVVDAAYLREQAAKCVRLANSISDPEAAAALRKLAKEYQMRAELLEQSQDLDGTAYPLMEPPAQT